MNQKVRRDLSCSRCARRPPGISLTEKPSQFVVVERWASVEALNAHLASPHIQTLFTFLPLLDGEPEISTFESLEEGSSPKGRW